MLCVWLLIGCGRLWNNFDEARWAAVRTSSDETVINYLLDEVPEVRAAAVFALGQLMTNRSSHNDHAASVRFNYVEILARKPNTITNILGLFFPVNAREFLDQQRDYRQNCSFMCLGWIRIGKT